MNELLVIELDDELELEFALEPTPITQLWYQKMALRNRWLLDDNKRFYGFNTVDQERQTAHDQLSRCINTINKYQCIIEREFTSIDDQDTLNYLHSIFEVYHGLLDRQTSTWWAAAPQEVKTALADLNVLVHRAESASRQTIPRFVCTWYGMPKLSKIPLEYMSKYGNVKTEFGGVYLNYVEIGKTLEDLTTDNDDYIGDDAFQPFVRYSADFVATFGDFVPNLSRMAEYFDSRKEFFAAHGVDSAQHPLAMPYRYKVAQLVERCPRPVLLNKIADRQIITDIYFK